MLLSLRYGEKFQDQDRGKVAPVPSGLLDPVRLLQDDQTAADVVPGWHDRRRVGTGGTMYKVTSEPEHRLVRIRVEGFWDTAVMASYDLELRRHVGALAACGGCRRILVDMSDYPVQDQQIAKRHADILMFGRDRIGAHVAVVMQSALSRVQARRLAQLSGDELFATEADARAWLLEQPV